MKTFPWKQTAGLFLFILIFWMYFAGVILVPFHPDESTQIYMSADTSQHPFDLVYNPPMEMSDRLRYRLLDSPITRTLIGWGLTLQGKHSIPTDWNWSTTWIANELAGALPTSDVLLAARFSVAWLFPFSCLFLFLAVRQIDNKGSALIAVILMAFNSLILLHTRRAMAESSLICFFCASLWVLVCDPFRTIPSALFLGLAVNSKQTAIPYAGLGVLTIFFQKADSIRKKFLNLFLYLLILLVIFCILNPVFWKSPIEAVTKSVDLRAELSSRMEADYRVNHNPMEQGITLLVRVFFQPPACADVLNYQAETKSQEDRYFSQPLNNLTQGFITGTVLLILTVLGYVFLIRKLSNKKTTNRYSTVMFLAITLVSLVMLTFFTPVPFQRYYIILIPLFSTAQAAAITSLGKLIFQSKQKEAAGMGSLQ